MSQIENNTEWKSKFLILGTAVGAVVGLGTAYLMARNAEETEGGPPKISTNDAIKVGVSVLGVVRGIASLGRGG